MEELAKKLSASSRRAFQQAQSSIEQVQQNWTSVQMSAIRTRAALSKGTSSLRERGRHVAIVTTASLPWMTGTAINPLLRAHFLADASRDVQRSVTLVVPWLSKRDQKVVYPHQTTFETPEQQEAYVRDWVEKRTGQDSSHFKLAFYPGRYAPEKGSILPVGDITQYIPDALADVAVLEEPEHLNWYHHGRRWSDKFQHVVGVMHTNYLDYARREENGRVKEAALRFINSLVCRIHCHKVIKLSDAVQRLPRQCTEFVHGVSPRFLEVGRTMATAARQRASAVDFANSQGASAPSPSPRCDGAALPEVWSNGAYFLGKVVWAKGYTELLDLLDYHQKRHGRSFAMDVFGHGDDKTAVEARASELQLPLKFHGAKDHADASLQSFKVFVNPSLSDVVATTTAEALAMGKFVVCADHPCNKFFSTFSNCLVYKDREEFAAKLQHALTHDPAPMSAAELSRLSWEEATERFLDAAELRVEELGPPLLRAADDAVASVYNTLTGIEPFRVNAGAGANTLRAPKCLTDFEPSASETGGFFDNRKRAQEIHGRA